MMLSTGLGFLSLLYVLVLVTTAVLVIWALVLTIMLLRSVLAERAARGPAGWPPPL
ncbi:hypothetical protein SAMN05518682_1203 [Cellulosimicrobium aquatile]|uniref:Uncharacterized protein n=1 Tax=Cellulosimicrobium aquatile TaxID=1612203 RepID=A0A1N6PYJ5_9MICO|nr:hypothetical protein [Cellulosimicrobium aquatile]SIQ09352.1 hypothetical protein SAMN05518682_1203 [Cellulosimicrobium aquatile]